MSGLMTLLHRIKKDIQKLTILFFSLKIIINHYLVRHIKFSDVWQEMLRVTSAARFDDLVQRSRSQEGVKVGLYR
jgi:hypothetical protein